MGKVKHHLASKVPEKRHTAGGKEDAATRRVDTVKAVGEVPQSEIEDQGYKDEVDDQAYARFISENGL